MSFSVAFFFSHNMTFSTTLSLVGQTLFIPILNSKPTPAAAPAAAPSKTDDSGKRTLKPYGKRTDSTGSTSRSRSATKELERKFSKGAEWML